MPATSIFRVFLPGILSTYFPRPGHEDLSPRNVIQKAMGVALIMAGVALMEETDATR